MISDSTSHSLIGRTIDCTTNASDPRTESRYRTKISPLAKSYASIGVGSTPSTAPISSASAGNPRPEKSMRDLRFSAVMLPIGWPASDRRRSLVRVNPCRPA